MLCKYILFNLRIIFKHTVDVTGHPDIKDHINILIHDQLFQVFQVGII